MKARVCFMSFVTFIATFSPTGQAAPNVSNVRATPRPDNSKIVNIQYDLTNTSSSAFGPTLSGIRATGSIRSVACHRVVDVKTESVEADAKEDRPGEVAFLSEEPCRVDDSSHKAQGVSK